MAQDEKVSYLEEIDDVVSVPENHEMQKTASFEAVKSTKDSQLEKMGEFKDESAEKYEKILQSLPDNSQHDQVVGTDAQKMLEMDTESRVRQLVDLAQTKGVVHAIKVARHIHDNYELDMLHAQLSADDVRNALESHGFLKSE